MSEDGQLLTIDECPICARVHRYPLKIETSAYIGLMTMDAFDGSPKVRSFMRVFRCPVQDKLFKAPVQLFEHYGQRIEDVQVGDAS